MLPMHLMGTVGVNKELLINNDKVPVIYQTKKRGCTLTLRN